MPEGDTVAGHARVLDSVLTGRQIIEVDGTAAEVRRRSGSLLGTTVTGVRAAGKHLIVELSSGYALRVHLGMSGSWRVTNQDRRPHGSARLVLRTRDHYAACYSAPTIEISRFAETDKRLRRVGPDLLGDFDEKQFLANARLSSPGRSVAEVLLDQRVAAGVGNVYKSELLFLEKIHPDTPVSEIADERLVAMARRARRLLAANVGRSRSTTGNRGSGRDTWVYGRAGRPCRRCAAAILDEERAGRITYWCPRCQATPGVEDTAQ